MNTLKHLPPQFSAAMHRHMALVEQFGEESPQAKKSLMVAMHLAPDWFKDDIAAMAGENGFLPQASGYLDDGSPVFSLEDIAAKFGISMEQAEKDLHDMMATRQELGLPIEGGLVNPSLVHRKQ